VLLGLVAACGSDGEASPVETAQARVTQKERAVTDAQQAFDEASTGFCTDTESYLTALDRYGKLFEQAPATVGDVKTAGSDLAGPGSAVRSSAQTVTDASDELQDAKRELGEAQVSLAAAQAGAAGTPTSAAPPSTTATTTTLVPTASVDRVTQAESDLEAASMGVTDQTPLVQAAVELNAAAFALEVAWLRLFADAGCLTDEQQVQAVTALYEYTVALQTALQTTGYYDGKIDGIYGPATVEAVKKLQNANGLPETGYVDRATATALGSAVASKGGAAATDALAHTATVQSTLKLAGYWTGPVDGTWTPELTEALKMLQTDLGVEPTGSVDVATLSAFETAIAGAETPPPESTSTTRPPATATSATK
jgi:peptidoglycan hydrolase-like protein with peptidoglycan-binding domain